MSNRPAFISASPYQDDVLALPVTDLDIASDWYGNCFGMSEVERNEQPVPSVILERDGIKIGFAVNGGDASQEGAAVLVTEIEQIRTELETKGVKVGNLQVDEREGTQYRAFFVVAPDGLCYYFYEPLEG